jgi:hypothetical protein
MTSNEVDLDINNYTKSDLMSFFKLTNNYTNSELENNEQLMKENILNSSHETEYKYEVLIFMLQAKEILKIKEEENKVIMQTTDNEYINNIGKIINPSSNHPSLQKQSITSNNINSYGNYIRRTNYVFDTRYRDDFFNTLAVDSTFTLPIQLNNVISITLSSMQFANTFFTFNEELQTNQLYIFEETTNNEGIVILPEGNYNVYNFPTQLEKAINEQIVGVYNPPPGVNRFNVSISEFTGFTTISNSLYNFRMNIIKKTPHLDCDVFHGSTTVTTIDPKLKITPQDLYKTLGYQIGYRNIEYFGQKSYTSESQFDSVYQELVYFSMNDFQSNSVFTTTYGVLPNSLIDANILAVIPIVTPAFDNTWDTMADYIFKTRQYNSPVNLKRLQFKLTGRDGYILNYHDNNFAFILAIDTIYDNVQYANII